MNTNINFKEYELVGGSAKIPEGLKINEKDIVFNEDDIIIIRYMSNYYWWEKKNSTNKVSNFCKANAKIEDFKLMDKGYPLSELKKEIEILKGLKSLEDVKLLKNCATEIKWHDIFWTTYKHSGHEDRVRWEVIPIEGGSPTRSPKYTYQSGYYEWGQHYSIEKEIE